MIFNRKNLIILLILLGAFLVIGGVCAQGDGFSLAGAAKKVSPTKTVTVKIYNFKRSSNYKKRFRIRKYRYNHRHTLFIK
jgi:hypothetical protein